MKAGIHAKLKWLARETFSPLPRVIPATQAEIRPGWFSPQTADTLLATPLRRHLMKIIWQRTSLSGALFADLYQAPVARFAERVQLLPASEYHHHSHPGGLLDHTLEVMAFAAKLRQRYLLPAGAAPEEQAREAEAWTAGILYAALLHDVGKTVMDIDVMTDDNQRWFPWMEPLTKPYRLRYPKNRDHRLHPAIGSLLALQILPVSALNWLAQYRELNGSFLYCISGHYDNAGVLGELVQEADRASVAQFMGANAGIALAHPQPSLAKQILTALRALVQTQFTLSSPDSGSDGWLTGDALWVMSKTTTDKIRAWLLQQGVTGVPDSNIRLFDEMQAHGLIIPTPEGKAVWSCNITADSGWSPGCPLTLLRLSPSRIWDTTQDRPAVFAGKVEPVVNSTANMSVDIDIAPPAPQPGPATGASETELTDLAFSLFVPQKPDAVADIPQPGEGNGAEHAAKIQPAPISSATKLPVTTGGIDNSPADLSALSDTDFLNWLREGVRSRKIAVNDTQAKVHMVEGKAFVVSPEIFKQYVRTTTGATSDEWKQVQKSFQKLKRHHRGDDGINIFTCEVRGPRKTRQVKGYLLDKPEDIFGDAVPEDNPYLSVISQR
ncbi:MobH family relaxase [Klebsiella pneumoniae]|uniref:MobH family relaxase n=1 Tax=Klebsiella pneumoniae TaxID=573 RepID=UPI0020412745|nr:MobH family relaxase [Klebsiella pneumoniae]USB67173.1 TraI domain-containing protein [Klebsiella pneumoniae]HBT4924890.1 DNA-binding domain-containing protein [Klebsiella pneumoniae]